MLKPMTNTTSKEQLLTALVASLKMLLVSLSFIVLFAVLFVKAIISFTMVALMALNMAAEWMINRVCSTDEMRSFLVTAVR